MDGAPPGPPSAKGALGFHLVDTTASSWEGCPAQARGFGDRLCQAQASQGGPGMRGSSLGGLGLSPNMSRAPREKPLHPLPWPCLSPNAHPSDLPLPIFGLSQSPRHLLDTSSSTSPVPSPPASSFLPSQPCVKNCCLLLDIGCAPAGCQHTQASGDPRGWSRALLGSMHSGRRGTPHTVNMQSKLQFREKIRIARPGHGTSGAPVGCDFTRLVLSVALTSVQGGLKPLFLMRLGTTICTHDTYTAVL